MDGAGKATERKERNARNARNGIKKQEARSTKRNATRGKQRSMESRTSSSHHRSHETPAWLSWPSSLRSGGTGGVGNDGMEVVLGRDGVEGKEGGRGCGTETIALEGNATTACNTANNYMPNKMSSNAKTDNGKNSSGMLGYISLPFLKQHKPIEVAKRKPAIHSDLGITTGTTRNKDADHRQSTHPKIHTQDIDQDAQQELVTNDAQERRAVHRPNLASLTSRVQTNRPPVQRSFQRQTPTTFQFDQRLHRPKQPSSFIDQSMESDMEQEENDADERTRPQTPAHQSSETYAETSIPPSTDALDTPCAEESPSQRMTPSLTQSPNDPHDPHIEAPALKRIMDATGLILRDATEIQEKQVDLEKEVTIRFMCKALIYTSTF